MKNKIGQKIRKIRELKGFSQHYMAAELNMSQRAYSKIEREEIKLDWGRLQHIVQILKIEPVDLISFDDSLVFTNCQQSGKINHIHNFPQELKEQYENRIKSLTEEVTFLRQMLLNQQAEG